MYREHFYRYSHRPHWLTPPIFYYPVHEIIPVALYGARLFVVIVLCTLKRELWVFASSSLTFHPLNRQPAPLMSRQPARSRCNNNKQALNVLGWDSCCSFVLRIAQPISYSVFFRKNKKSFLFRLPTEEEANFFKRRKQFLIPASPLTFQLLSTHRRSEKVYRGSLSRDQLNRKLIVTVSQVIVCCTFLHGWRSRKSQRYFIFMHWNGNSSNKSSAGWKLFLQILLLCQKAWNFLLFYWTHRKLFI